MKGPALNLTYEISRHSTNQTYLYFLNSTRLQPVWDAENSSYYRIGHTSDVPYIFNEAIVGGDNSNSAFEFSAQVSSSFSKFATSGNPSTSAFQWPIAYGAKGKGNPTIFVIGGPYGSGPVTLGPGQGTDARSMAVAQEKLLQRCAFIDSIVD